MRIQVVVDEDLLKQVMQVTHIQNSQLLVEKALRFMLEPEDVSQYKTEDKWQQFFNTPSVFGDDFLVNRGNDIAQERDF
jgi:hypothetical protein